MNLLGAESQVQLNAMNIVDRPLPDRKARKEVSLSALTFLYSELVQYTHRRHPHPKDLERRLQDIGYEVRSWWWGRREIGTLNVVWWR